MADKRYAGLSFDEAVKKYATPVLKTCIVRLNSRADAEDCLQNTFFKLYHRSPAFHDEDHLKAWLLRVAINECKKTLRHHQKLIPLNELENTPSPTADDRSDITWALLRLEPKYREVIYLYYYEQYKVNEIAAILSKNTNTVKSLLKRGRDKLKQIYGGDSDE